MKNSRVFSAGLAMFAMLFGAGNVVFPLALGRDVGSAVWFALAGFCLMACLVPLIGVVSTMLYEGDYRKFLGTMGRVPATVLALICMVLIGPFGCIPRCVTVSHAAVAWYFPSLTLPIFSALAGLVIFAFTLRKSSIVDVIGRFLGPIKLTLLLAIVVLGLVYPATSITSSTLQPLGAFTKGLMEGYGTMDLLGGIFFAGLIFAALRKGIGQEEDRSTLARMSLKAGLIGAALLGVVYAGFCLVAAQYASSLQGVDKGQLLSALANAVLGSKGGLLANVTVAVSCLTTAIALTVVFAEYLRKEVLQGKVLYLYALLGTIVASCIMTNFGFQGIMALIFPVVAVCYPALIVLALLNIAYKLFGLKPVRLPVLVTLVVFFCMQWL